METNSGYPDPFSVLKGIVVNMTVVVVMVIVMVTAMVIVIAIGMVMAMVMAMGDNSITLPSKRIAFSKLIGFLSCSFRLLVHHMLHGQSLAMAFGFYNAQSYSSV